VRGGLIALELVQADKGKMDKAMVDRAAALFQRGALCLTRESSVRSRKWFSPLQYQTGQYTQLLADYKRIDKLPEAAQAEVLLLAANSERQLPSKGSRDTLSQSPQIPGSRGSKGRAYQQLINVYNSDPSALSAAVDQFLATNPTNERADQAKLLKAEALYKQQSYTDAASMYGELRASELSPRCAPKRRTNLGLPRPDEKTFPASSKLLRITCRRFPNSANSGRPGSARFAYEQSKNYTAALTDLTSSLPNTRRRTSARRRCN